MVMYGTDHSALALLLATLALAPVMLYVTWSDMKAMRIPNTACLAVFAIFLATGSWGLPFETFLWRIAHAAIAFGIGFALFQVTGGKIGGGDIKLTVAFVPFIVIDQLAFFLFTLSAISLVGVLVFLTARRVLAGRETGLLSLNQKVMVPLGVSLSLTILIYMTTAVSVAF